MKYKVGSKIKCLENYISKGELNFIKDKEYTINMIDRTFKYPGNGVCLISEQGNICWFHGKCKYFDIKSIFE